MGYGRHCWCKGLQFLWENNLSFKDRIFYNHCTILSVKTFELVSDGIVVSMWFSRRK